MLEGFSFETVVSFAESVFSSAFSGDPTSIILLAGIAIVILVLVFGVSAFLFGLVKRFFLFIVIGLSVFYFASNYYARFLENGLSPEMIVVGAIGIFLALSALIIAFGSLFRHAKEPREAAQNSMAPSFTPTQLQMPQAYTTQALTRDNLVNSLKDDRSLLAVLSYVIIAQFGVFSSKTISAPNPEIGMAFFAIFAVGALIFIKTTYRSYVKGISHLIIASVFGIIISIALGHYWNEIPLETLLSLGYFGTEAMVAFITGIAISLLMGTKN